MTCHAMTLNLNLRPHVIDIKSDNDQHGCKIYSDNCLEVVRVDVVCTEGYLLKEHVMTCEK